MGIRLAVLALAMGLAALNTGNNLIYLMLALVLGLAVTSAAASVWSLRLMRVTPHLPAEVLRGRPFLAGVEVSGRFPFLPQTWVDVRILGLPRPVDLEVAVTAGDGRGSASTGLTVDRRGVYGNLSITAVTGYPLDLAVYQTRRPLDVTLTVLPAFRPLTSLKVTSGGADGFRETASRSAAGAGFELRDIREYTPADDARHIDWRSSARTRRLMVREFERERDRSIDLVLDHESPDDEAFEPVIERCAAILDLAARSGYEVRLLAPGRPEALPGPSAMRYLASAQPCRPGTGVEPLGRTLQRARTGAVTIVLSALPGRSTPIEVT